MKLKRSPLILFAAAALILGAFFISPIFIRLAVIRSIQNAVPGSQVTLETCRFVRGNGLEFNGVRIALKTPSKDFPKLRLPGPGNNLLSVLLASVSVHDLRLDIQTSDLSLRGTFSFTRNLRKSIFENLSLGIPSLILGPAEAMNIIASSDASGTGNFSAENVRFSKFKIENLRGRFQISDGGALLEKITSDFWGGTVKGRLALTRLDELPVCTAELDLADIPVAAFLKLWEWDKKCAADGSLKGRLLAEVAGGKLTRLDGTMLSVSGGNLVILDQAFLENIAARAKQPIEIVKASFENYHYNTGTVGVSLQEKNLRLELGLEGEKGKRDLEVTLHDWF